MIKNVLAGAVALTVAYFTIKAAFWVLGGIFSLAFSIFTSLLFLIPLAIISIPLYFVIRKKLFGDDEHNLLN